MNQARPIKVMLVDDHTLLRETLRDRLGSEMDIEVIGLAASAEEAVRLAREVEPDVIVMDIDMPGRLCFDAARDIVSMYPNIRIVYLSAFFSDRYIEDALAAHALSYVTKDEPPTRVIEAVREASRGIAYFSPSVQSRLIIGANNKLSLDKPGELSTKVSTLTRRELEMLRYLARGLSKKEIAATIHRSYGTVDKHVEKLMAKLDIHDRVELARFAIREGLAEA